MTAVTSTFGRIRSRARLSAGCLAHGLALRAPELGQKRGAAWTPLCNGPVRAWRHPARKCAYGLAADGAELEKAPAPRPGCSAGTTSVWMGSFERCIEPDRAVCQQIGCLLCVLRRLGDGSRRSRWWIARRGSPVLLPSDAQGRRSEGWPRPLRGAARPRRLQTRRYSLHEEVDRPCRGQARWWNWRSPLRSGPAQRVSSAGGVGRDVLDRGDIRRVGWIASTCARSKTRPATLRDLQRELVPRAERPKPAPDRALGSCRGKATSE